MVRGSRLPSRLQALKYGADIVYTDEHIDLSLLMSKRRANGKFKCLENSDDIRLIFLFSHKPIEILGTYDYINEANGYCTFRTSPEEKDRLVFQIGKYFRRKNRLFAS